MARRLPLTFDGCAATLHQAGGDAGVVIVAPPGFEDLCSHRALDQMAEMLADAGAPTLRFDLPGTGDSSGDAEDPRLVDRWIASVSSAIDELRRLTEVDTVSLVGLRVGALLAAEVAARWGDVARLALLAPPPGGKAYVRELKVLSRVIAPPPPTPPELVAPDYDGLELAGFRLNAESIGDLQRFGWPDTAPCANILVVARQDVESVLARWEAPDIDITRAHFHGYEKMMCDPTATVTPVATLRAIADYLAAGVAPRQTAVSAPRTTALHGGAWIEEHLSFGVDGALTGVLCRPSEVPATRVIALANAGGIRRVGWGRQHVELARDLAKGGVASLRFDLRCVSGTVGGDPATPFHYGADGEDDIIAAVGALSDRGFETIELSGACSGAYHALRAGVADARVTRLTLINQLCFEWGPDYSFPLNAWMMQKASDVERRRNAEDEALSELARLRARLMARAIKLAKTSAKGAFHAVRAIAKTEPATNGAPSATPPELAFAELAARGVRVDLVYAENDDGLVELERWFGPQGERATALAGVTKTILPAADHLLTPRHARAALLEVLLDKRAGEPRRATTRAA